MRILQNELFRKAEKARYKPNIVVAVILCLLFIIIGQTVGAIIEGPIIYTVKNIYFRSSFYLFFSFIFIIIFVFIWVKFVEKREISSIGIVGRGAFKKFFVGFFIGLLLFSLVTLILVLAGMAVIEPNPSYKIGAAALPAVLIILPGWIVQSSAEEIAARGWLMNILGARYSSITAVLTSSLFFGFLQILNTVASF